MHLGCKTSEQRFFEKSETIRHIAKKSFLPDLRDFSILASLFLLLHVPFLTQAFIIDDGIFIDQALHIINNPTGPYSIDIHYKNIANFF